MEQQLLTNIRSIDCDVLDALASGRDLFGHRDRLQQLRIDISELRSQDRLSRPVAQAASSLARRIAAFANVIIKLQQDGDHVVNDLGTHLATVLQGTFISTAVQRKTDRKQSPTRAATRGAYGTQTARVRQNDVVSDKKAESLRSARSPVASI